MNYCLLDNLNTTKVNTSCMSIKYCITFDKIVKRSKEYCKYYNHEYVTYSQLTFKIDELNEKLNDLKLQNLSKEFRIIAYKNKINLYKRFNVLLATQDVKRLQQLMQVCLKNEAGIKTILEKFCLAANDMYRPKGFTNDDIALGNRL